MFFSGSVRTAGCSVHVHVAAPGPNGDIRVTHFTAPTEAQKRLGVVFFCWLCSGERGPLVNKNTGGFPGT